MLLGFVVVVAEMVVVDMRLEGVEEEDRPSGAFAKKGGEK